MGRERQSFPALYSLTGMATEGTVSAGGRDYTVSGGLSWMDHQFGHS